MRIKSLKDVWNLPKGLKEVKRTFQNFDQDEDPEKVLEEILACAKRNPVLDDLLKVSKTYDMISRAEKTAEKRGWNYACNEAVKEMCVNYEVRGAENIPKDSRVLYVSNHLYGLLDGAILVAGLGSLLSEKGRKLRVIGMNQLRAIKGIEKIVYFVHSTAKKINFGSLKKPLRYIQDGGDLAIFPSGRMSKAGLEEYPWKNLRIFLSYSSKVVPMWISGPSHGILYNVLATFKKTEQSRRIFSFNETWNKKGKKIVLNIGKALSSTELRGKKDNGKIVQSIREAAEALKVAV
jgi:1-acyl-sn-glycerol-3-phosphate acyltransferase